MNPEQIKIIIVIIATLLLSFLIDSRSSGSASAEDLKKIAAIMGTQVQASPEKKTSKKSNTSSSKPSCRKKGFNLYGNVQFVDSFPDLTIEYVSSFPDINVQFVSSFPSNCGQWKEVDSFPDFKVQVVSSFADLKVKKVSSFPGME